jgi:hypothetical protein
VGCYKDVNSQVKFFISNQQRVIDVSLDDVRLGLVRHIGPVADFVNVSEQENSLALAAADLNKMKITGFIIQRDFSLSLFLLNSSRKIGYSLGRL